MSSVSEARKLLDTALGCPWCGKKPIPRTKLVGLRDEPSRVVMLACPACGASKTVTVAESQEYDAAVGARSKQREYETYEQGCVILCLPALIKLWNQRV